MKCQSVDLLIHILFTLLLALFSIYFLQSLIVRLEVPESTDSRGEFLFRSQLPQLS